MGRTAELVIRNLAPATYHHNKKALKKAKIITNTVIDHVFAVFQLPRQCFAGAGHISNMVPSVGMIVNLSFSTWESLRVESLQYFTCCSTTQSIKV